jgi:exosome complex RNA-binding protein Csl4
MACVPGTKLGDASEFESGSGTYILANAIYASVVGAKSTIEAKEAGKPTLTVLHDKPASLVQALLVPISLNASPHFACSVCRCPNQATSSLRG